MITTKMIHWTRRSRSWALLLTALAPLASCSGLVDPGTQSKAPEQNVRNYYVLLTQPKMEYRYAMTSKNVYQPERDILLMNMQGKESTDVWNSTPVFGCNWSYVTAGEPTMWYYALDDNRAVDLGVEYGGQYTDSWVDLQAPIAKDASWTFQSKGETIIAKVAAYGVTASVEGKTYDDVVMVKYSGDQGTAGTSWFARGIGTIYTTVDRPGDAHFDAQYQGMMQK